MEFIAQTLPQGLFYLFCLASIACAFGVIVARNPVSAAFCLVGCLLNVAGIFAMQSAFFLAAIQVLVYAGAIMVLFVFVIMLLSIDKMDADLPKSRWALFGPAVLGAAFFALLAGTFLKAGATIKPGPWTLEAIEQAGGNVRVLSESMFSDYILPFLIVGMLLSISIVGAVVLAKRKVD